MFSATTTNDYVSYKKLVRTLESNFGYNLQSELVGKSSLNDVVVFRADILEQQALISESSYEYSNEKYKKNVIVLEALSHLVKLMEIRTYRLEPKTGALINHVTRAEKQKTLDNPKDNRPDLYFTQDHLNIEEPIAVVGADDNDVVNSITNAANQVAPEDNMKKAEVYVGVNDGNPNYSTPTNTALETELAGLTASDLLNITDRVKKDVKKEIAKDISDAVLLQKRKNEELKMNESEDSMSKKEVEDLLAAVRKKIADQGRIVDDRLLEKERKLVTLLKTYKLGEGNMSHKILSKLLESEMEKAEIVLGVKAITDDLQQMAEKISRMQIEDISALTERLKAEFGIERGDQFQAEVGNFLGAALTALQQSKSSIDNTALALTGDSGMAAGPEGAAARAVAPASAPALAAPEGEEDMFGGHEAGAGPEEAPLGRVKKESIDGNVARRNKLLAESKKLVEKMVAKFYEVKNDTAQRKRILESIKTLRESMEVMEAWDTEMHTAEKDKGMFAGKPQAKIRSELAAEKKRQEEHKTSTGHADPKISKEIKQHEFALRAKHNFAGVNEAECTEDKQILLDEATRKHFRATAETLKHVPDMTKRKELAKSHADEFKKMNPRFSHAKFFKACDIHDMNESAILTDRGMGNAKKVVKDANPKTPKNTAKLLDAKAGNVKKK